MNISKLTRSCILLINYIDPDVKSQELFIKAGTTTKSTNDNPAFSKQIFLFKTSKEFADLEGEVFCRLRASSLELKTKRTKILHWFRTSPERSLAEEGRLKAQCVKFNST